MKKKTNSAAESIGRPWLFLAMTRCPYPFLVTIPFVFILLIFLGLSRPSLIEEDISNLWIPTDGTYKKDKDYAKSVGANTQDEMSAFAAMALSRHGANLFQEDNLNAIVERMQRIETTTVMYKGMNFTWNDICLANGLSRDTTYKMPCLRISAMDLFQEARWYFDEEQRATWYDEVKGMVMKPLVIRYGILNDKCVSPADNTACDHAKKLRSDPNYAQEQGYPASHAGAATDLLQDIFGMELNDPCRICIEEGIDERLQELKDEYIVPAFTILTQQLRRFLFALEERDDVRPATLKHVESLIRKTASIATKVSRRDVEDFYMYYIIRNLYGEGAAEFQAMYREVNDPMYRGFICGYDELVCPPEDITLEQAREYLLNHADNLFSSHVTFGAPFPFWSRRDGTGHLFAGNYPVSGSGINMSAPINSMATYLDLEHKNDQDNWRPFFYDSQRQDGYVDPLGNDYLWESMVETNPVYAWFMAGETEMTAHCGNGELLGTNISDITIDMLTAELVKSYSQKLCTKYHTPFEEDGAHTQQHFARMWFDLLIDSPFVLDIMKGESDPYTWTSGIGCGYDLGYPRFSYTEQPEDVILQNASGFLYNIDEGAEIGVVDRTPLIGDVYPPVGEYSFDNPLQHVGLLQTLYATLVAADISERVQHKNRPGGPLNITEDDAREVLGLFKHSFESLWTSGWDDDEDGEVQFVGFFDDAEVAGTLGTFLNSVTLSSGVLTAVSILVIAVFSIVFLARRNPIESRIGITLIGVVLVMLAFFAAVGLGILIGIKVNLTIAWSLPFIMIGLGVDNIYIILMSLAKQKEFSDKAFYRGMKEVLIPITMTSCVVLSMFAVMNVNDIPAVYLTARVACFAAMFLYFAALFCFPAYCYLDMQRQDAGRRDVFVWRKYDPPPSEEPQISEKHFLEKILYDWFYQPLMFGESYMRVITHSLIWACAALLLGLGLYGISVARIGLGLEDFLPASHQANVWATARTEILGSWPVSVNWPDVDYSDPHTQMKMIKQFESVIKTPYIVEIDTRMLWVAEFALYTTRQCDYNMALKPSEERICGRDQVFDDGSTCSGTWKRNVYGLREKFFSDNDDQCQPHDGGVCRPTSEMMPDDLRDVGIDPNNISADEARQSWCPVFEGWSQEKMTFCIRRWYEHVDGMGGLILDKDANCDGEFCEDYMVKVPILYSSGPAMAAKGVVTHELTLEMMKQTRAVCDQDPELHCWMSGPSFDFWSQYEGIHMNLVQISGAAILIGFGISLLFFACKLFHDGRHPAWKILTGSLVGATIIAANCFFCLVVVVGISILSGVSLTAFSIMSFVLSVGFAVEYSVHIVSRWLRCDHDSALDRVEHTMSFLMLPTFMSFVSSTVAIAFTGLSGFSFNTRFFFRPLIIVMFVTYFFGCYWLPVFLTWLDFGFTRFGVNLSSFRERCGSPLSKMQDSESSEAEVAPSTGSHMINEDSDDVESSSSSLPKGMGDCMKLKTNGASGESPSDSRSFDFLPCYNMADCGSALAEGKSDDHTKTREMEENSLLSDLPRPLGSYLSEEGTNSRSEPSILDELEDNSILSASKKPDPPAAYATRASVERKADRVLIAPSSLAQSRLNTIGNRNAPVLPPVPYTGQLWQETDQPLAQSRPSTIGNRNAPSLPPVPHTGQIWQEPDQTKTGPNTTSRSNEASDDSELDVASSATESGNNSSTAEVASSGSADNVFEGIDVVPATDVQNAPPPLPIPVSMPPIQPLHDNRPARIETSPQTTRNSPQGPASTGGIGGIFRADGAFYGEHDGLPPLRQSYSSSPRKKKFPVSPLRFKGRGSSSSEANIPYGEEGLLSLGNRYDTGYGGYDFGHVLEGSAIHSAGPNDPPRSNREILKGGSGEVLSVHAVTVFEDDTSNNTVNF